MRQRGAENMRRKKNMLQSTEKRKKFSGQNTRVDEHSRRTKRMNKGSGIMILMTTFAVVFVCRVFHSRSESKHNRKSFM